VADGAPPRPAVAVTCHRSYAKPDPDEVSRVPAEVRNVASTIMVQALNTGTRPVEIRHAGFVLENLSPYRVGAHQHAPELEQALERKGKKQELAKVRHAYQMASFAVARQSEPLGLCHAVLCAKNLVGDEPFAVMLGDNLFDPDTPNLPRMIELHEKYGSSVLSLFECTPQQVSSYGIVAVENVEADAVKVTHLVEKPALDEAPSNLAVDGCYILTPDIFEILEKTPPGRGGEIQLHCDDATPRGHARRQGLNEK